MNVKVIVHARKGYSWNPSTCICENSKHLISIEYVLDIASTQITNTIATNVKRS